MAEYIDREEALAECDWYANEFCEAEYAIMPLRGAIRNIPAADVAPVRNGRWEEDCAGAAVCSVCNEYAFETNTHHLCGWFPPYCPNCGAKMDKEET